MVKNVVEKKQEVVDCLLDVNCSDFIEKKSGLSYIGWANAWKQVIIRYPEARYEVIRQENGLPYSFDENTGYMVFTKVCIESVTHEMWLPVLNGANKAMKAKSYTYETKYGKKTVEACSMFDINTAIMRCLVKNLAMFGLGLYIYMGEEFKGVEEDDVNHSPPKDTPKIKTLELNIIKQLCSDTNSLEGFLKHYNINKLEDFDARLYDQAKAQLESKLESQKKSESK